MGGAITYNNQYDNIAQKRSAVFRFNVDTKLFYSDVALDNPTYDAVSFSLGKLIVMVSDVVEVTDTTTGSKWQAPTNITIKRSVTWAVAGDTMYWTVSDQKPIQTIQIKYQGRYLFNQISSPV